MAFLLRDKGRRIFSLQAMNLLNKKRKQVKTPVPV